MIYMFIFTSAVLMPLICPVVPHGRLLDPPGRSTMWRYGYDTPPNYNDHELYCGGYRHQWLKLGGKCGICGDAWDDPKPRDNEAGGKYAKGIIVRTYKAGTRMQVIVDLTVHHKGYFEFRLCPNNNTLKAASQQCLDRYILQFADGTGTRFYLPENSDIGFYFMQLVLPKEVTCSQCVFQWKYSAGNSWGVDPHTGHECMGCGGQEQFYGCADIAIKL